MESWFKKSIAARTQLQPCRRRGWRRPGALAPEAIPSRKKIDFQTSSDLSILGAGSSSSNALALPRDY